MKYKEWLAEWLDNYIKPSAKEKTYSRYANITYKHIIPKLGDIDIDDLRPLMFQKFTTELMINGNRTNGKGLSANSVNSVITVIQNSLKIAYMTGITKEYCADKIKRPKANEKPIECFTFSEQKMIERAVLNDNHQKMIGIIICLYTGLRIGELLALEWSDINFSKCEMSINKSCHDSRVNGVFGRITDTPKTQTSNRIIPIPKQLLPLLRETKSRNLSKWVVGDGDKAISVRTYQYSFEALQRKLNIKRRGFHTLRHTFATRALECGMDVKTLSEILGHKNPNVTLNRYAHSLLSHKHDMMDQLGKIYK